MPNRLIECDKYRKDIDGLRAYAVIAVVIFHFGFLPNGFLGVDVFFVISGYLITGIIYHKLLENQFSLKDFYIRRTKRIIPLVLFTCLFSIICGVLFMLPDDLENLAQSVVATNLFNNNTLQVLTTKDYWNIVNEFKPLMHTWSLAIEEQFYLFYPFLFLGIAKIRIKLILPILILLTLASTALFFSPFQDFYKFYLLPFRFFELSIGGIAAILLNKKIINHQLSIIPFFTLIAILSFKMEFINPDLLLFLTVLITTLILISANKNNTLTSFLLENKLIIFIGKLSFSIYMWHQILLAFGRYLLFPEMQLSSYTIVLIFTTIFSISSYYLIEQPFRFKLKTKKAIGILSMVFLVTTGLSFYIFTQEGILKNIPELDLKKGINQRGIDRKYNNDILKLDLEFVSKNRLKILVLGNSFARDWVNVLLESKFRSHIEISYIFNPISNLSLTKRAREADYIFISNVDKITLSQLNLEKSKVWYVGPKNFGISNGIFYNYSGPDYCTQRTKIRKKYLEENENQKKEWGDKYIDLIELVIDDRKTVPVFTPDCKFISQDCVHLTKNGAKHFASLIQMRSSFILNQKID